MKNKISDRELTEMVILYNKGLTFREISRRFGRVHQSVTRNLRRIGVMTQNKVGTQERTSIDSRRKTGEVISKAKTSKLRESQEMCVICLSNIGLGKRVGARVIGIKPHDYQNILTKHGIVKSKRIYLDCRKKTEEAKNRRINSDIARSLKDRVRDAMRRDGRKKDVSARALIGCDLDYFRTYIESKFTKKMNWGNYGKVWHLDHIIPCCKFDLTNDAEVAKCFNYRNYRPLCAVKNLKEGGRKKIHQQELLMI